MTPWRSPPSVEVCIVDPDQDSRRDLRSLVSATPGFVPAGEASSTQAAIKAVPMIRPDLVLIAMAGMGGVRAAEILACARRDLLIVLITAEPFDSYVRSVPEAGQIAVLARSDLSARTLLDLWHGRRTR